MILCTYVGCVQVGIIFSLLIPVYFFTEQVRSYMCRRPFCKLILHIFWLGNSFSCRRQFLNQFQEMRNLIFKLWLNSLTHSVIRDPQNASPPQLETRQITLNGNIVASFKIFHYQKISTIFPQSMNSLPSFIENVKRFPLHRHCCNVFSNLALIFLPFSLSASNLWLSPPRILSELPKSKALWPILISAGVLIFFNSDTS